MRRGVALLGLAALAAGCATTPSLPPVENPAATWQTRQAELKSLTAWTLQGRLAVHADDKGWQASVHWVRAGARQSIDLAGPLGQGHLRLVKDDHGAELRDADRRTWRAENAEQLLFRATGWRMPLDGMDYWVLGLPSPDPVTRRELDAQGRLKTLVQSGWDIQFLEYSRYGSLDLPSKLFMQRRNGGTGDNLAGESVLEVRLIVERWSFAK